MIIAAVIAAPAGLGAAWPAFTHPAWLAWGAGVGICSSVIPYVTDQLAMAALPRASFALLSPCSPRSPSSPARPFSARSPPPGTWPASRWSSPAWPSTAQAPGQPM